MSPPKGDGGRGGRRSGCGGIVVAPYIPVLPAPYALVLLAPYTLVSPIRRHLRPERFVGFCERVTALAHGVVVGREFL